MLCQAATPEAYMDSAFIQMHNMEYKPFGYKVLLCIDASVETHKEMCMQTDTLTGSHNAVIISLS